MKALIRRSIYPVLLVSAVCLVGCGGGDEPAPGDAVSGPVAGGTAVVALAAEPDMLNPLLRSSSYTGQVLGVMTRALAEMDDDLRIVPSVAERWRLADDGRSLTCRLKDWRWADGRALRARDVVLSSRLLRSPDIASPLAGVQGSVADVVEIDSMTVRFDFAGEVAEPLQPLLAPLLPWHVVARLDAAEVGRWPINDRPLANGSFAFESWQRNEQIVLRRNEHCGSRVPLLERLVLRIIPDETARVVALETGHVDLMEDVPIAAAKRLDADDAIEIHRIGGRLYGYVSLNFRNPIFADRRVRQAISRAIDRSRFADGLLGGFGRPAASPIPPGLWAHAETVQPHPCDPDAARRLLAEAGWSDTDGDGIVELDGAPLSFELITRTGDAVREQGAVVIRDNLRAVGIEVRLRIMEHGASIALIRAGDYEAYLGLMSSGLIVDPSGQLHSGATGRFNYGAFSDAVVDSLIDVGLACRDRETALPVWQRLQEVVAEEVPIVMLYYPDSLVGVSKRLRDVRPHMLSPLNNISEWWIAAEDRRYAGSAE